jgi:hypothetical protein
VAQITYIFDPRPPPSSSVSTCIGQEPALQCGLTLPAMLDAKSSPNGSSSRDSAARGVITNPLAPARKEGRGHGDLVGGRVWPEHEAVTACTASVMQGEFRWQSQLKIASNDKAMRSGM